MHKQSLTITEQAYVRSYEDVIAAVCSVDGYVTSAHRSQLDSLEMTLGEARCAELQDVARRRMGL